MPVEIKFKREDCGGCGGPLYEQCINCLKELCADCYMLRTCRVSDSGRHLGGRPDPKYMTFERFHNALRILLNIDRDQFEEATGYTPEWLRGSGKTMDDHWTSFRVDPWKWFMRADDQGAKGVWSLVVDRMTGR